MNEENEESLWRRWCVYWLAHPFTAGIILIWPLTVVISIVLADASGVVRFFTGLAASLIVLQLMENAAKKEVSTTKLKVGSKDEFDEVKKVLMAAARDIEEERKQKGKGKDPNRRLQAVCRGCDNGIYSDDELFTDNKGHCFCDVCWELRP